MARPFADRYTIDSGIIAPILQNPLHNVVHV